MHQPMTLANDLTRFLRHEPIAARPVSRSARMWRWCKRKPLVAGLIAAVAVSIVAGTSISLYLAVEAREQARRATEGTRIALTTLESLIFDVQKKLRGIPEAQQLRKELLRSSLEDLRKISAVISVRRQVDRSTASALLDLGHLYREVGNVEEKTAFAAAEDLYRRARSMLEQLVAENPDDRQLKLELGDAYEYQVMLYLDSPNPLQAQEPIEKMMESREELAQHAPDESLTLWKLSSAQMQRGDLRIEQRNFQGAN